MNDVHVRIYVVLVASYINPKQNWNYGSGVDVSVEFDIQSYTAYRNGTAVPASDGAAPLAEILQVLGPAIESKLMGGTRPNISLFTHAWVHNQHYGLVGTGNKVVDLMISDGWCDVVTEQYRPVVMAEWRATAIDDNRPGGVLDTEGDAEWLLRMRSFVVTSGGEVRLSERNWR